MNLFDNKQAESKVHLSIPEDSGSNQDIYRLQYMEELLRHQESINQKLADSIESINTLFENANVNQKNQHETITARIEHQNEAQELIMSNLTHLEAAVTEKLEQINKDHFYELTQLASKEEIFHQALLAQLTTQEQITNTLLKKLTDLEKLSLELNEQMQENQRNLSSKLEVQDVYHQTVMERIDHQEALAHKMDRQLDSLKALFFERIAHLSDKIESQTKHMIKTFSRLLFKPAKSNEEDNKEQTTIL